MHLEFSKKEELFREEVSSWLSKNLKGKFKSNEEVLLQEL